MPVRRSSFYYDPQLGQAIEGLGKAFAPPSGQDLAGYATAGAKKQEAERLAWLFGNPNDPTASARAALTGVQGFGQTPAGFGMTDATNRYKIGVDSATDLERQRLVGANNLALKRAEPLVLSEGQTAFVPPAEQTARQMPATLRGNIAAKPGEVVTTPTGEVFTGTPKPLGMDEWLASQAAAVRAGGGMSDEQVIAAALKGAQTEGVVGPDGKPRVAFSATAAAQGMQPVSDKMPKPTNMHAVVSGRPPIPIVQNADGSWRPADSREPPLPQGWSLAHPPTPQGTNEQVGIATKTNIGDANNQEAQITYALNRVQEFKKLLAGNPGVMGVPGKIRGLAQDFGAFISEMEGTYGKQIALRTPTEVQGLIDTLMSKKGYDPAIRQAYAMALEMAYLDAKASDPSGEVNVREMERFLNKYDGGLAGNMGVMPGLNDLESRLRTQLATRVPNLRAPGSVAPPAAGTPSGPAGGRTIQTQRGPVTIEEVP